MALAQGDNRVRLLIRALQAAACMTSDAGALPGSSGSRTVSLYAIVNERYRRRLASVLASGRGALVLTHKSKNSCKISYMKYLSYN